MNNFDKLYNKIINETIEDINYSKEIILTPEEVCKDQGYVNSCQWDEKFAKHFKAAADAHKKMKLEHPEEHDSELVESPGRYNCTHVYSCKCGYSYKVDSSD